MSRSEVTRRLAAAGCIAADAEAGELIAAAAGDPVALRDLVARRCEGEPVAWLTGFTQFCGRSVAVVPGVYVPRRQTEPLARRAAALLPAGGTAVDLCTGAGAIAVVLAGEVPTARVVGTDLDPVAAACARANGIEVFEGHLDDPLPPALEATVDVLASVVPYVPTGALGLLPRDVVAYEPRLALDGGAEGLDLLEQVARRSVRWLAPGGWLLLELGGDQPAPMSRLLQDLGYVHTEVMADEDGDPRAICAQRPT